MGFAPTPEQQAATDAFATGDDMVLEAGAGTGKTSTLKLLAAAKPNTRIIYLAYNKSIATEAQAEFPGNNVRAMTAHSLAYRWLANQWGDALRDRLNAPRMKPWDTAKVLGANKPLVIGAGSPLGARVIQPNQQSRIAQETVKHFCYSADEAITARHVPAVNGVDTAGERQELIEQVLPMAQRAWEDQSQPNGRLFFPHDVYVKMFGLSRPHIDCDAIFLDEAQDCQPPGTAVLVPGKRTKIGGVAFEEVKIEDLRVGDKVVSYNRRGPCLRPTGSTVTSISSRPHDGELIRVESPDGKASRYTPEHICIAKMGPAFQGKTLLYLMRRGTSYRVGITSAVYGSNHGTSGPAGRMLEEKGEAVWVLDVFDHRHDAMMAEEETSVRFGIPQMRFIASGQPSAVGQDRIDTFWERMGDLTEKARACATHFGRDPRYPLAERSFNDATGARSNYLLYSRGANVRACNLLPGMELLDVDRLRSQGRNMRTGAAWVAVTVTREPYVGPVWSMDVENDHTYVADGLVTHNCNPALAGILKLQDHAQRVAVGDSCQAIYGWRGASDYLAQMRAEHRLFLSQSFRFGDAVADEANKWLTLLEAKMRLRGAPESVVTSSVASLVAPDAVLCRTNAESVSRLIDFHAKGKPVALVGSGADVKRLAEAADQLKSTGRTSHPELCAFESWAQVQEYVEQDAAGGDLKVAVDLIDEHGTAAIINAIDKTVPERPGVVTVSTAHKAKGREWNNVRIANDFREPQPDEFGDRPMPAREEMMLAYVAVTRAQRVLDNDGLAWVDQYLGHEAGRTGHMRELAGAR